MAELELLTTEQATALLTVHRATLWRWYAECREFLTGAIGGAVAWNKAKLLARREQLQRQRLAAVRTRARQRRLERAS